MHAGRALQQSRAGVQQHRPHPPGHLRVAHRHIDGQGLVPAIDVGGTRLLVDLLASERLPHRRPFRTRGGDDVVEAQAAKGLQNRFAAIAILLHHRPSHDLDKRAMIAGRGSGALSLAIARAPWRQKEKRSMEFGMFHQFPALPGRPQKDAFEEAFAQIDAAERWGLDVMWLATVDQISGGRLIFGVGRSGLPRTYEDYGVSYSESRDRFAEVLDILEQAWS